MINFVKQNKESFFVDTETQNPKGRKKRKIKKIFKTVFLSFFCTFLIAGLIGGSVMLFSVNSLRAAIFENNNTSLADSGGLLGQTLSQLKDLTFGTQKNLNTDESGWVNILLLGLPGANYPGEQLTDTILIAMINLETSKVVVVSIPRDLAVQLDNGNYSKINATFNYYGGGAEGTGTLIQTVKEVTNIDIQYYVRLDFEGFENFIDTIGGVDIDVVEDIYDPSYPTPGYGTEVFEISKGFHHLDGKTALKYVRTRHTSENDFGRSKRQQQVIKAVIDKLRGEANILDIKFNSNLLKLIKGHVKTNMELAEAKIFYSALNNVDLNAIENAVIDSRDSGLLEGNLNKELGSYLLPVEGPSQYEGIHKFIKSKRQ